MNRATWFGAVGLCLAAIFIGIYFASRETPPLLVGFISGQTGKAADLGIDVRRGAELAVAAANGQGGVGGRTVELVVRDDGHDEERARAAVEELLAMDLEVIVGHSTSAMTMATLPMVNKSDTLLVAPTTSTPLLRDIDDNFFRSCAVSTVAAVTMARYLRQVRDAGLVGVVYDLGNRAYTEQWYEAFAETFLEQGGEEVLPFTFTSAPDVSLLDLVGELRRHPLDTLVIVANSVDGAMLCQQVRKIGWQVPLALADWAATEQLIALGGAAVEGAVISQFFNRQSTEPEYLAFKQEFMELYKSEPGFGALHAYNATMMVLTSMAARQQGESLKETILRLSHFNGLQDDIVINRYGDSNHPTYMGVIENGSFMILEDFR